MPKSTRGDAARADQVALMLKNGYMPAVAVAKRVGVSLTTVGRWADEGSVESEIVGHRRYIKVDSLIRHLGPVQAGIFGLALNKRSAKKSTEEGDEL